MSSHSYIRAASSQFSITREVLPQSKQALAPTRDKLSSDILYACRRRRPHSKLELSTYPPSYLSHGGRPNGLTSFMLESVVILSDEFIPDRQYLAKSKERSSPTLLAKAILDTLNEPKDNASIPVTPTGPFVELKDDRLYFGLSFTGNKLMMDAFTRSRRALLENVDEDQCKVLAKPMLKLVQGVIANTDESLLEVARQATDLCPIRYDQLPLMLGPIIARGEIFGEYTNALEF